MYITILDNSQGVIELGYEELERQGISRDEILNETSIVDATVKSCINVIALEGIVEERKQFYLRLTMTEEIIIIEFSEVPYFYCLCPDCLKDLDRSRVEQYELEFEFKEMGYKTYDLTDHGVGGDFSKQLNGITISENGGNIVSEDNELTIRTKDFEIIIMAIKNFKGNKNIKTSTVYHYNNEYYLSLHVTGDGENMLSCMKEYGDSVRNTVLVKEYGKVIIQDNAIEVVSKHF